MEAEEWIYLDASQSRFFLLGEEIGPGQLVGWGLDGQPVWARQGGCIRSVVYDVDRCELVLGLSGGQHGHLKSVRAKAQWHSTPNSDEAEKQAIGPRGA